MLPHSRSRVALGQPRGLRPLQYLRGGTACHAYIPHYRQLVTRSGSSGLPRPGRPARRHLQLSERDAAAADQAAAWLLSGQWKQQLAAAVPEAQQRAAAGAQSVCMLLAGAMQQAQAMWQYLLANWPAWKASLQEDAEIVMEYALGLIPAWLAVLYASIVRACQDLVASAPVQQAAAATAAAVAAAEASAFAVTEAAQQSVQQVAQLVKQTLAGSARGSEGPQDGGSRRGDEDSEHHQLKRGSNLEAARVAYSIAFFGFGSGSTTSPAHLFAQHAQQLAQHMSLHDWQEQQLQQQQQQQPRRWRKPQRRDWVDRVAHRALKANSSSSSGGGGGYLAQARDHLFRPRHDGPVWAAPVRAVTGALQAAQHGVQGAVGGAAAGCAEAVRSVQATGRAAVGGVARAGSMVVTPVQHAVQRLEPPPAGVLAVGMVLLAGAVTSTAMQRQRKAGELAVQQRKLMQQRAEELRAQKARVMGVLSVEAPKGSGAGRRKGAPAAVQLTNIPVTVVGSADSASTDWDAEDDSLGSADVPAAGGLLREVEMDPEAAAMWKKFLAGSRAVDVPMWNNRMVEDLPKVSRREMDKQTQKIRSAAAPEEREAIEQADMEQLSRQLQQLDHAPIGRAARSAWLKEQQQKRQAQAQEQPQVAAADGRPRSSSSSPSADRPRSAGDNSNPFAIPQEVRANWDTDLDDKPRAAAAPRKQAASRATAPTSSGASGAAVSTRSSSRSGSRPGSRSGSRAVGAGGSDNPFAIPQAARAQWEAEDHLFSEPAKPILGGVLGGLVTGLTSGKAQPSTAQQHQERRRHALRAEAVEAAAILRLQQQQEEQEQAREQKQALSGDAAAGAATASQRSARDGQQQQQPTAAAMAPAAAGPQAPAAAGQGAAAAAAVPAGLEGLEEGSPEWHEKMRQEMARSGAARRARMQQMRMSQGAGGAQGRQGQKDAGPAASAGGSSSLSVVSAADAAGVTAAIPAPQQKAAAAPAAGSVLGTGDAAGAAAADKQKADSGSPSAV